jgi:hypothetical protein
MRLRKHRLAGRSALGAISMVLALICGTGVAGAATATQYYVDGGGNVCVGFGPPLPAGSCEWGTHARGPGIDNVALGENMMPNLVEGDQNVALDRGALEHATEATSNIAIGNVALQSTTDGLENVAVGVAALNHFNSHFGGGNTATGDGSLYEDTTGEGNVGDGLLTLVNDTTGELNVGLGSGAGFNLTSGSHNIDVANEGVSSDTGTTRIGTNGEQKRAFMAGIYGVGVKGPACTVRVTSEGQLGCKGAISETSQVVGGGIGGEIGSNGFAMSLYAQTTPTPMIQAGTISHFTAHFRANVSTNTVLVLQKNGASTGITCTVAPGGNTCSDNTDSAEFAASDTVLVRASYTGSNTGTNPSWSANYP